MPLIIVSNDIDNLIKNNFIDLLEILLLNIFVQNNRNDIKEYLSMISKNCIYCMENLSNREFIRIKFSMIYQLMDIVFLWT